MKVQTTMHSVIYTLQVGLCSQSHHILISRKIKANRGMSGHILVMGPRLGHYSICH